MVYIERDRGRALEIAGLPIPLAPSACASDSASASHHYTRLYIILTYLFTYLNNTYLGVHIIKSRVFRCSLTMAKRSFYRAAKSIFRKVGRIASEEVTLHLLETKCITVLLYGLEARPLTKNHLSSIDFVVNKFFMKLFKSSNIAVLSINIKKNFLFSCRVSV